ncbi:right-handed parallel beta-helix repeat-containing protein [Bradymonas sediminis]|uniref:Uncharacterized protein n=1 Tax=Bradymonas sediminis TaxID=1548548 RepID=A0A2Z4FLZ2_9DELT|nr:right-handed parallel beta-helix repeat-containing protein [Bradymonas sediminis]AWV89983.1 hypothetical protein DN745_11800 [Bradymonas sediminis]TDP76062.1 MYXO-CTERM domain-containing protein [Bradymonas sediminis]
MPRQPILLHYAFSFLGALAVTFMGATSFAATVQVQPGDDLRAAANALNPGDELVLADGTYEMSPRFLLTLRGTAEAPIVIRAADGAAPLIHRPNAEQNIWDIDAEHLHIRGLRFSGGSAGLRFLHAEDVRVEDCEIFDTNAVALRMNDSGAHYRRNFIIGNEIYGTAGHGEGMYLGCNSNGCQFSEGLIAHNYIHHTNGPNVTQGDGIEIKEGGWGNTIRGNVIHDTGYPCILTYSTAGNGPANIIEGNVMWACGDNGIQTSQDAIIRNNIILGAAASGIALQPHQAGAPANLEVIHNTVVNTGDAIALRGATGSVVIANNAAYSSSASALRLMGDMAAVQISGNVGVGGINGPAGGLSAGDLGADFVDAHTGGGVMDVYPSATGALVGAGDTSRVTEFDFNGLLRMGVADVGAYRFDSAENPGWTIAPGFKDTATSNPGEPGNPGEADAGPEDAGSFDVSSDTTANPDATVGFEDTQSAPDANDAPQPQPQDDNWTNNHEDSDSSDCCGCAATGQPTPAHGLLLLGGLAIFARRRRPGVTR